jgi:hypothetical protein
MVVVDFGGTRENLSRPFAAPAGANAWSAIQHALGAANVSQRDFGGDLGVMITGLFGVTAQGNHFWEFLINGESSSVGVGSYLVREGDRLELRYSSF